MFVPAILPATFQAFTRCTSGEKLEAIHMCRSTRPDNNEVLVGESRS
jgi:hypothetical protein